MQARLCHLPPKLRQAATPPRCSRWSPAGTSSGPRSRPPTCRSRNRSRAWSSPAPVLQAVRKCGIGSPIILAPGAADGGFAAQFARGSEATALPGCFTENVRHRADDPGQHRRAGPGAGGPPAGCHRPPCRLDRRMRRGCWHCAGRMPAPCRMPARPAGTQSGRRSPGATSRKCRSPASTAPDTSMLPGTCRGRSAAGFSVRAVSSAPLQPVRAQDSGLD